MPAHSMHPAAAARLRMFAAYSFAVIAEVRVALHVTSHWGMSVSVWAYMRCGMQHR